MAAMKEETKVLKAEAERGRQLYRSSLINQSEAKKMVNPYLEAVNEKAIEIAKKYGMKPKKVQFRSFVR